MWPSAEEQERETVNCTQRLNGSLDDLACEGLARESSGDPSADACTAACCADATCSAWQWCADGSKCDGATGSGAQCWTGAGTNCAGHGKRKGWVGRGNLTPPGPSPNAPVSVTGVRVADNVYSGHTNDPVGTQATLSLTQSAATSWTFDFCDQLLFPQIAVVRIHVVAASGFPVAVARPTANCTVTVETSEPVTGTITVEVDSSKPSPLYH